MLKSHDSKLHMPSILHRAGFGQQDGELVSAARGTGALSPALRKPVICLEPFFGILRFPEGKLSLVGKPCKCFKFCIFKTSWKWKNFKSKENSIRNLFSIFWLSTFH